MHARQISEVVFACLVLCAVRPVWAQATVPNSSSTVDLDGLSDPGNTGKVSVDAGTTVETNTGSALRGTNKSADVTNQGSLISHDAGIGIFAVHLQNGKYSDSGVMAALAVLLKSSAVANSEIKLTLVIAFIALLYSFYALYSAGKDAVYWGALVTFFGWVLYGFITSHKYDLNKKVEY